MINSSEDVKNLTRQELEMHYNDLRKKYEEQRIKIVGLENDKTRLVDRVVELNTALSHKKTEYNDLYRYVFGEKRDWLDRIFGKTCWIYNKRHHIQR